ncbi:MAG: TolC family protein [Oligoflexia bacterium]|nr:TolC family protein [Oligoflexia bacterium]
MDARKLKLGWRWLTVLVLLGPASSAALEPPDLSKLSLEQAEQEGLNNSPEIQASRSEVRQSGWNKLGAFSEFLPKLELFAGHTLSYKFEAEDVSEDLSAGKALLRFNLTEAGLRVKVPLFDGFRDLHHYRAELHLHEKAALSESWESFKLTQEIRDRFSQALADQLLEAVAEQDVKTLEDHQRQVRNLIQGGAATQFDILRIDAQLEDARSNLMQSQDNVRLSRQRLAQALGYNDDRRPLDGALPVPAKSVLVGLPENPEAGDGRADIEALRESVDAQDELRSATLSEWLPSISLIGEAAEYNNTSTSLSAPGEFNQSYQTAFLLTWNLFDGMKSVANRGSSEEQTLQSEKKLDRALLTKNYDLNQWKRRYRYNADFFQARIVNLKRAEENLRIATTGLENGTQTSTDVLDAEQDLFRSRAGVIAAQLSAEQALIRLELALGKRIR